MSAKLDKLMQDWKFQKEIEEKASAIRKETEIEIYKEMMSIQEMKEEGTNSYKNDEFKLTVVGKYNYTADQDKAKHCPDLFKVKYEYSKTMLKEMTDEQINTVENCVTKTVTKPSFKVERI